MQFFFRSLLFFCLLGISTACDVSTMMLRISAATGDAEAQYNLGLMYRNGTGVPQSDTEAVKWYRKAADQGDATAQNNLGLMYRGGKGVPQSDTEAVKWYRKATDQGNALAQSNLGFMYENGKGS